MDIRKKILETLDQAPGKKFSIGEIALSVGSNSKGTSAALGKLLKSGLVDRPEKGLYSSKARVAAKAAPPAAPKAVEPIPELSVITIELLVEAAKSKISAGELLGKILEDKTILDAKVRKIAEANPKNLKIRLSLADE